MNVAVKPEAGLAINRTHMAHELDAGLGARCRIGIIELSIDQTSEHEFRRLLTRPGVDFYVSRIPCDSNISRESLAAMERDVENGAALIMPNLRLDVMGFTCTSGAMVIGEDRVFGLIRKVRPDIPCTSPITGAMAGIAALGLKRVAVLTPYVQEINDMMRAYIEARGVGVPVMGSFNNPDDEKVARITLASVRDAAIELGRAREVDGVFVSCTSLRTIDIVAEVEAAIGKPMISSNQAQAWHMLRLGKVDDRLEGYGRLFGC
jgi:maleate isomerase